MDLEHYFKQVEASAEEAVRQDQSAFIHLDGLMNDPAVMACANFRGMMLTEAEITATQPLLEIGYFRGPQPLERVAWFVFSSDVNGEVVNRTLERACHRYTVEQPLFAGTPPLFNAIRQREGSGSPDFELIDEAAISCIHDSEIYHAGTGFAKLVPCLRPGIVNWAREKFPTARRYLRLDPYRFYRTQPLSLLQEAALVPANPHWMSTVALFPRTKEFAAYVLEDCDPRESPSQYWDFHVRDIRRLEVTAQRREADYLTMMIEELPRPDAETGLMVAKCIHLDTRAAAGTPMTDVRLEHLDLAINVYSGAARAARMADSLQNGKVLDATYRTHLYRVEDVPFPALFGFAELFLSSKVLVGEWLTETLAVPTA